MYGRRIAQLRAEKKLNQSELASIFKIAKSTISMYELEKREPDIDIIIRLAAYFGVSTDYLLGVSNERGRLGDGLLLTDENERRVLEAYRGLDEGGRGELRGFLRGYEAARAGFD
jgi:transcriptional regulator with XRE-family HTH domain